MIREKGIEKREERKKNFNRLRKIEKENNRKFNCALNVNLKKFANNLKI
jgi:hypothetical protein